MDKTNYLENFGYESFLNFAQECVGDRWFAIRDIKSYNYSKEEDKVTIHFSCDDGYVVVGIFYPQIASLYFYDPNSKNGLGRCLDDATKSWQKVVLKNTNHKEEYLIDIMYRLKDEAQGRFIP